MRIEKSRKAQALRKNIHGINRLAQKAARQAREKSKVINQTLVDLGWAAAWQGMKMIGQEIIKGVEQEILSMPGECGGYEINASGTYEQRGCAYLEHVNGEPIIILPPGEEYQPIE
jgi:hypothetical protein